MNKKILIIMLSIIFVAMIGGITYLLFFNEYSETVNLQGTTLNTPHTFFDKMNIYNDSNNVYCIENNGKYIIKYWSMADRLANGQLSDTIGSTNEKLNLVGQTRDTGANPVKTTYNGEEVYVCFTSNIAHGNIMIIAKDPDTAKKIYNSIKTPSNQWNNNTAANNTAHINVQQSNNNQSNNNPNNIQPSGGNNKPTPDPTPSPSPSPSPVNSTVKNILWK